MEQSPVESPKFRNYWLHSLACNKESGVIYFFRRQEGSLNQELNMRLMEEWFQHEEERGQSSSKLLQEEKQYPFLQPMTGWNVFKMNQEADIVGFRKISKW